MPAAMTGWTVSKILAVHPGAARAFLARRMACPGCPFAAFETLAEAARAYGADPDVLVAAILEMDAGLETGEATS